MTSKKWVYLFSEVEDAEKYAGSWEGVRALLGGKGAGLADMTRAGVPVPPGFTVTTEEQCLLRQQWTVPRRHVGTRIGRPRRHRGADRQKVWQPGQSPVRLLPFGG